MTRENKIMVSRRRAADSSSLASLFYEWSGYLPGLALLAILGYLSKTIASYIPYVNFIIVSIVIGMILRNTLGLPKIFEPGVSTYEFWLKTGIILLGARLVFQQVFRLGGLGLALVVIEIIVSIAVVRLMTRKFRISDKLGSLLAIGVGICGVSAIIGCAGAIDADEKDQGYAIATIIIFGVAALFFYPLVGYALDMGHKSFGIWAGLAVHNTPEAVGTGFIYSDLAGKYATLAKLSRNALMGVVILGFAVHYARLNITKEVERKGLFLWQKFPKFILGFVLFSILSTIGFFTPEQITSLKHLYNWSFMLTFVGVGFAIKFDDMKQTGLKPFAIGFGTSVAVGVLTLLMVLLIFGHA